MQTPPLPVALIRCAPRRKRRRWPYLPTPLCNLLVGLFLGGLLAVFCYLTFGLH